MGRYRRGISAGSGSSSRRQGLENAGLMRLKGCLFPVGQLVSTYYLELAINHPQIDDALLQSADTDVPLL